MEDDAIIDGNIAAVFAPVAGKQFVAMADNHFIAIMRNHNAGFALATVQTAALLGMNTAILLLAEATAHGCTLKNGYGK